MTFADKVGDEEKAQVPLVAVDDFDDETAQWLRRRSDGAHGTSKVACLVAAFVATAIVGAAVAVATLPIGERQNARTMAHVSTDIISDQRDVGTDIIAGVVANITADVGTDISSDERDVIVDSIADVIADIKLRRGSLAIIQAGVKNRLLFNSTLDQVVRPNAKLGFTVHWYMSLIDLGNDATWLTEMEKAKKKVIVGDPAIMDLSQYQFGQYVYTSIKDAGGKLMWLHQSVHSETLDPLPDRARIMWGGYCPFEHKIGRNVLRRYKSTEFLWNKTIEHSKSTGIKYDWVLWIRDDPYWTHPFPLANYHVEGRKPVLYTRDCNLVPGSWGGGNNPFTDKVLLMNNLAADIMLRAYSNFYWNNDRRFIRFGSINAESFLQTIQNINKIDYKRVNYSWMSGVDAAFQLQENNKVELCIKMYYADKCLEGHHVISGLHQNVQKNLKKKIPRIPGNGPQWCEARL